MTAVRMLKSRRFHIALAGVILMFVLPLVVYRFWWYPNTLRGRFDRIQIGMTENEVKDILGEPDASSNRGPNGFPYNPPPRLLVWRYYKVIAVWIDQDNKVCGKCWVKPWSLSPSQSFYQSLSLWDRVKQWLPFS